MGKFFIYFHRQKKKKKAPKFHWGYNFVKALFNFDRQKVIAQNVII